jgi:hypothetical protein
MPATASDEGADTMSATRCTPDARRKNIQLKKEQHGAQSLVYAKLPEALATTP